MDANGRQILRTVCYKYLVLLASPESTSWNQLLGSLKMLDSLRQSLEST
jgi:hypothetical protein